MKTIEKRGKRLMEGISEILTENGIRHCMSGYPAMFSYALGVDSVADQRSWNESEKDFYLALVEAMIERGVMPDHDPREPWFLCYSHGEAEIDRTLEVFRAAVKAVKK